LVAGTARWGWDARVVLPFDLAMVLVWFSGDGSRRN